MEATHPYIGIQWRRSPVCRPHSTSWAKVEPAFSWSQCWRSSRLEGRAVSVLALHISRALGCYRLGHLRCVSALEIAFGSRVVSTTTGFNCHHMFATRRNISGVMLLWANSQTFIRPELCCSKHLCATLDRDLKTWDLRLTAELNSWVKNKTYYLWNNKNNKWCERQTNRRYFNPLADDWNIVWFERTVR